MDKVIIGFGQGLIYVCRNCYRHRPNDMMAKDYRWIHAIIASLSSTHHHLPPSRRNWNEILMMAAAFCLEEPNNERQYRFPGDWQDSPRRDKATNEKSGTIEMKSRHNVDYYLLAVTKQVWRCAWDKRWWAYQRSTLFDWLKGVGLSRLADVEEGGAVSWCEGSALFRSNVNFSRSLSSVWN